MLYISEILNSVEGLIVGVVHIGCIVYGSSAKEENVVSLKDKVNILEADFVRIVISSVNKVTYKLPVYKVGGAHKGQKISLMSVLGTPYSADDGIIFARYFIEFYLEF